MKNKKIVVIMVFVALFCSTSQASNQQQQAEQVPSLLKQAEAMANKTAQDIVNHNEFKTFSQDPRVTQMLEQAHAESLKNLAENQAKLELLTMLIKARQPDASLEEKEAAFKYFLASQQQAKEQEEQEETERIEYQARIERDINSCRLQNPQFARRCQIEENVPTLGKALRNYLIQKEAYQERRWKDAAEIQRRRNLEKKGSFRE